MSKNSNKYRVTVSGWVKLITVFGLILSSCVSINGHHNLLSFLFRNIDLSRDNVDSLVFLSVLAYIWLFVCLSIRGSNNKIAKWISGTFIFKILLYAPLIISFLAPILSYSDIAGKSDDLVNSVLIWTAMLPLTSILLSIILSRLQGGIRRWSGYIAFLAFPFLLYIPCRLFYQLLYAVIAFSFAILLVVVLLLGLISRVFEGRADIFASGDKSNVGRYTAKWENMPQSDVNGKVIRIRGTIIVEYSGVFHDDKAEEAVQRLLNSYSNHVANKMPGYTVKRDGHDITVKHRRID